ncbi:fasciclin-like arabinogalactan protein 11 [Malania oleifera]|uniref:fasciclin-like arabinogalactan protein 11 n=1 Tax=Malania oleifera TaxID=397392 RepID=UPI0025AE5930|nr:fasciclin-like arabinogalactan protein 11 [Malania oleifera]
MKSHLLSLLLICVPLLHCTSTRYSTTLAKTHPKAPHAPSPAPVSPAAPSPAPVASPPSLDTSSSTASSPSAPPDIVAILKKEGGFSAFIRLLGATQVDDRITKLLGDPSQGLTLFAPNDDAFSHLRSGVLNSLSDRDQVQLVLFHMLSSYFPMAQFQTSSNPLHTEAGDTANGDFPLNVTTGEDQAMNLTTGIDSAAVTKTVYTDGQLAVYEVDQVLLPAQIFASLPSAFAPPKRQEEAPEQTAPTSSDAASVTFSVALGVLWIDPGSGGTNVGEDRPRPSSIGGGDTNVILRSVTQQVMAEMAMSTGSVVARSSNLHR